MTSTADRGSSPVRTKRYVDKITLPPGNELGPAWNDFLELFGRPATQAESSRLRELGLNIDGDFERSLGRRLIESLPDARTQRRNKKPDRFCALRFLGRQCLKKSKLRQHGVAYIRRHCEMN